MTRDALETLGTIIDPNEGRDAVHVAVISCRAPAILYPGEAVTRYGTPVRRSGGKAVGVVDPFLTQKAVQVGEGFWIMLYPRTITGLQHVWSHPDFDVEDAPPPENDTDLSERWLQDFAEQHGEDMLTMIAAARRFVGTGERFYGDDSSKFEGYSVPPEFWDHYERFTGFKRPDREQGTDFFACSC